jgi:peptide/nickel transport system substrate-binding protein
LNRIAAGGPNILLRVLLALLVLILPVHFAAADALYGIAMRGAPALPADFKAFPYVNPNVKKGGKLAFGVVGTFNNLNPFIIKGKRTTARGMWDPELGNLVFESLMMRSRDEPFTMYGLLAESVEWDEARTFIQFNLNPRAKWSDGQPVTPDDVIFTFELLRDKGAPPFSTRLVSGKTTLVEKMEKVGDHSVRFTLSKDASRELPLLLALSPVLPKHATNVENFEQTTMKPLIGSGPYLIRDIRPGEKITFQRDPNYWGKDIPSMVGFNNFDQISVEYFLQDTTLFEAFKKGEVDVFKDGVPRNWSHAYNFPAALRGDVVKDGFDLKLPANTYAMVFNTRRPIFANRKLREGLTMAFDFEWINKNLYENAYKRTQSFWQNSDLSSFHTPANARELALLGPARDKIDPAILDGTYQLPVTDGSGRDRKVLKQAFDLIHAAGYTISDGKMRDAKGTPLTFEILCQNVDQEKIAIAYQRSLAALGITVSIRTVEDAQYQQRSQTFDFDMILRTYAATLSPGVEQISRWGSASRNIEGSENMAGVADPDIDRMIDAILAARTPQDFQAAIRAEDRLLISGHYVIPLFHVGQQWIARWKYIGRPDYVPLYGAQFQTWWDQRVQ